MEIKLTGERGGTILVSPEDYDLLSQYKWHQNKNGYVRGTVETKHVFLHRFIMNAPKGLKVDHVNRKPLDNQRDNLRLATTNLNNQNKTVSKSKKSSQYRGVFFVKQRNKFKAKFCYKGKEYHIGFYETELEAAIAFDIFIIQNGYDFVNINFPENKEEYTTTEYKQKETKQKSVKYTGVTKHGNRYQAYIDDKGRKTLLSSDDPIKCAKAYDKYIIENNLINRTLNFPQDYPDYKPVDIIRTLYEPINETTVRLLVADDDKIIKIDKEDYNKIKLFNCYIGTSGYVLISNGKFIARIHRFLMGVTDPLIYVDHSNSDILDNRKDNLRISNAQLNGQNRSKTKNSVSKYIGVTYDKKNDIWNSRLTYNGKTVFSCSVQTEEMAARKRDLYIMIHLPDSHYKLNFKWTEYDKKEWTDKLEIVNNEFITTQTKIRKDTSSKYIGINYMKNCNKWCCRIRENEVVLLYKLYDTEEHAARHRDIFIMDNDLTKTCRLNFKWTDDEITKWKTLLEITKEEPHKRRIKNTKYIGISFVENKWYSLIRHNNKIVHRQLHEDEETAARARDIYLITHNLTDSYKMNFAWTQSEITEWKVKISL